MKLFLFPHSHYCEKGWWALDHKELRYRVIPLLPGFHIKTLKKYAPNSSVPVLLTGEEVAQTRRIFDAALQKLEEKLGGNEFLVDGTFIRADLSLASMLSILVLPPEHPFPWGEIPDPEIREFREGYTKRHFFKWVRGIYRNHRNFEEIG